MRKIVVGMAALAAVAALAACSTAAASGRPNNTATVARTTSAAVTSTVDTTSSSTSPTTTTPAETTTKAVPPVVRPPAAKPPVVQAAPVAAAVGVPCEASAKACVSLSSRKAWLIENGQVVLGPVSIMPGRPGFRTPVGTFHVLSKVAHYWSHAFNAPMPEATFFYPGVAFHIGSLSVPSHGCIHMSASTATTFFNTLNIGDEVQVLS